MVETIKIAASKFMKMSSFLDTNAEARTNEITKPVIASITSQPLPSLGGHSKGLASDFEDINLEEQKFDANREERLKYHRDILMKSKQESRLKELQTYQASQSTVDEDE